MDSDETNRQIKSILNRSVELAKRRTGMGTKSIGGEILQVQGGHIVRSTGRKDRHSKVFTTKGPRDRRVRLSAHTAIQFYDVQDRLGYDRPSKAVDWLIKMAKSAIDNLSELPHGGAAATEPAPKENEIEIFGERSESSGYRNFQQLGQLGENLIPPPPGSAVDFQSYRNLGLSLQTQNSPENSALGFDDGYEKMAAWNNAFGLQPFPNLQPPAANYGWNDLSIAGQKCHLTHEQSTLSSTRFISDGLPEFDIQGLFDGDVVSGKESSRFSLYSRH